MAVRNLNLIFNPRSVAVLGASRKRTSLGSIVLANLVSGGYTGTILPVNPKYRSIDDRACFAQVGELPEPPDLAVICTPAAIVPQLVRECGEAGIRGLLILSAGFRETGSAGGALEQEVKRVASTFDGMRIIGPNCLGIMAPHAGLNASFASASPLKGHVAFVSQSGAICTAVLDWALQESVGFSYFISVGNMLDVSIGDLIDYLAMDRWTDSLILYLESVTESREFMSAARAFSRKKPIIAYKAGRFVESAQAAASHTGAMAGVDAVYEAAFRRAGIVRVVEMGDMFDCAELLARQKTPRGPRLAIITNAGGPGVMAVDALLDRKGVPAKLSEATIEKLNEHLPAAWSRRNPVDVLGDATAPRLAKAVELVLAEKEVDAALVIFAPQAFSKPTDAAKAVAEVVRKSNKPVLTSWMGGAT
ncbi:MAG: acetate--CoA ligase family protein, partial [Pirellulaceae bacterium]